VIIIFSAFGVANADDDVLDVILDCRLVTHSIFCYFLHVL